MTPVITAESIVAIPKSLASGPSQKTPPKGNACGVDLYAYRKQR